MGLRLPQTPSTSNIQKLNPKKRSHFFTSFSQQSAKFFYQYGESLEILTKEVNILSCVPFSCSENILVRMFLHWEKPGWCLSASNGQSGRRGRRNCNKTCSPGLSNGKLIMPQCPDRLSDSVSYQRPADCLTLTHRATCHKDHSRSWQQTLKMSESKGGAWEMSLRWGEPL